MPSKSFQPVAVMGVLVAAAAVGGADLPGARPIDPAWNRVPAVEVVWKDTWDETYGATTASWKAALDAIEDDRERDREATWRRMRLLEAMLAAEGRDGWAVAPRQRVEALKSLASINSSLGFHDRSLQYLRAVAEAPAAEPMERADALGGITSHATRRFAESDPESGEWLRYAAGRMVALVQAGPAQRVTAAHGEVRRTLWAHVKRLLREGEYLEAWRIIGILRHALEDASDRKGEALGDFIAMTASVEGLSPGLAAAFAPSCSLAPAVGLRTVGVLAARAVERAGRGDADLVLAELYWETGLADRAIRLLLARGYAKRAKEYERKAWKFLEGDFPTAPGLAEELSAIGGVTYDHLDRLSELLPEYASGRILVETGRDGDSGLPTPKQRYASAWVAVDQQLRRQGPQALAELRDTQDAALRRFLAGGLAGPPRDPEARLSTFRHFPFSSAAQSGLMEWAEEELRDGHAGLAAAAFRDVLAHAPLPEQQARARVGLWLAVAQKPNAREQLPAAFAGVEDDARFPWLGGSATAAEIRERLMAGAAPSVPEEPPALEGLALSQLALPSVPPGSLPGLGFMSDEVLAALPEFAVGLARAGELVVAAGPNTIGAFRPGSGQPLWHRTFDLWSVERDDKQGTEVIAPGVFTPTAQGDKVFTRWGLDPTGTAAVRVACFEAGTGRMIWITPEEGPWRGLSVAGDPVLAEGRLYMMASGQRGLATGLFLVCVNPDTGELLWRRELAMRRAYHHVSRERGGELAVNLTIYAGAPTVAEGRAYCVAGAGIVACVDARDGVIDWVATYPRAQARMNTVGSFVSRLGLSPLVTRDRVLIAPRDARGVFALDRSTGRIVWEAPFLPSRQLVGLVDDRVILAGDDALVAAQTNTGKPIWLLKLPGGIRGRVLSVPGEHGRDLLVATRKAIFRVAAGTGQIVERRDLPPDESVVPELLSAGRLYGPATSGSRTPGQKAPVARGGGESISRLPLKTIWSVRRPRPELWVPRRNARLAERAYAYSQGMLECVLVRDGSTPWRVPLRPGFDGPEWADGLLLFGYPGGVLAIDGKTGRVRWSTRLPFECRDRVVAGPYLIVGNLDYKQEGSHAGAIDLDSGKLLWHRRANEFHVPGGRARLAHVDWDGKHVRFLVWRWDWAAYDVRCLGQDGTAVSYERINLPGDGRPSLQVIDGVCFQRSNERLLRFQLSSGAGEALHQLGLSVGEDEKWYTSGTGALDPYVCTQYRVKVGKRRKHRQLTLVLRRDDPAYLYTISGVASIRGDFAGTWSDRTLGLHDLTSRQMLGQYAVPRFPGTKRTEPRWFWSDGRQVVTASATTGPRSSSRDLSHLQVDVFEAETARHVSSQILFDMSYWSGSRKDPRPRRSAFAAMDGVLVFSNAEGVHGFAPAQTDVPPAGKPLHIVYRSEGDVSFDSPPETWDGVRQIDLTARDGRKGRLWIAHDERRLYLSLSYPSNGIRPHYGLFPHGSGSWMELGFGAPYGDPIHLTMAPDSSGSVRFRLLSNPFDWHRVKVRKWPEGPPQGMIGRVEYNPATGLVEYRFAVPQQSLGFYSGRWRAKRNMEVSVAVWDDQAPGAAGPLFEWGRGLREGEVSNASGETVYFHPISRPRVNAARELAESLPDLKGAWQFRREAFETTAISPTGDRLNLYRQYVRDHPDGDWTDQALLILNDAQQETLYGDGGRRTAEFAREAGVSDRVLRRFLAQAGAHISQRVYLDPSAEEANMSFGVVERSRAWGWSDWRETQFVECEFQASDLTWRWKVSQRQGEPKSVGEFPREAGGYVDVRLPLYRSGIHDRPFEGLTYTVDSPAVRLGRAALIVNGQEYVLAEPETLAALLAGDEKWRVRVPAGIFPCSPAGYTMLQKSLRLAAPETRHLARLEFDRRGERTDLDTAIQLVEKHGRALADTALVRQILDDLDGLTAPDSAARRSGLGPDDALRWRGAALRTFADDETGLVAEYLDRLVRVLCEQQHPEPVREAERIVRSLSLGEEVVYTFLRRHVRRLEQPLAAWHVVGPFPDPKGHGLDTPYPPELRPADLAEEFQTAEGQALWRRVEAGVTYVDFGKVFPEARNKGVAYAVCWVYVPHDRPARIELLADGEAEVWLNQSLVKGGHTVDGVTRVMPMVLPKGWNELLAKVTPGRWRWRLNVEIRRPDGGAMDDMRVRAAPPLPGESP